MNSKFPFAGICEASHEQTRTTFALLDAGCETCLVDVSVGGFNTSPDFEPGETTQNIVDIPTVQELAICLGNFLKSRLWLGSTPDSQVVTCGAEFHVNSNSSCVSAYFPARCTACPAVSVCHTLVSARLLTHPDDSSTSALSQLKKHLHIPSVSRFTFQ